jgi:hypothetical protein
LSCYDLSQRNQPEALEFKFLTKLQLLYLLRTVVLGLIELVDYLFSHREMETDAANVLLTPPLQSLCCVSELELQIPEWISLRKGLPPALFHSRQVSRELRPDRLKLEATLCHRHDVGVEN